MPVGTTDNYDDDRFDLKTAPPDGYVVIRRLSYGESLKRDAISTKFTVDGSAKSKDFMGDIKIDQEAIAQFDFAHCVVEHNITDKSGRTLNFKDPKDLAQLDGKIGKEIGDLIDEVNKIEGNEEVKNS